MANKTEVKPKLVKLYTDYSVYDERVTLWGVDFVSDGKKEPRYIAECNEETAKSLIDANRAKPVK